MPQTEMHPRFATSSDLPAVHAFLTAQKLPTAGLTPDLLAGRGGLLLLEQDGELIASIGLERHAQVGLLRSVAVAPAYRSRGIARHLTRQAVGYARHLGLTDLYLLTTTAADYFPRLGFRPVPRDSAPHPLHASAEFQGACPASATLMHLPLKEQPLTRPLPERTMHAFLHAIRTAPDLPLEFRLHGQPLVPAGYHVTEVKAVSIQSMDCGGTANAWNETVIQLMDGTPDEQRAGFMTTRKFLSIYDRVAARIPVQDAAEVRFEYGNVTSPALQYHVSGVDVRPDHVVVNLTHPGVMCKATGSTSTAGRCCAPATPELIQLG